MAEKDARQSISDRPQKRRVDLAALIKYILLVLLLLLLVGQIAGGEVSKIREGGWLAWFILLLKLLLIALLIVLIRVQRDLRCELTAPQGCTEEEPDPVAGKLIVRVKGTAAGAAFGSYTLAIRRDGDPPLPGIVSYPGGGASGTAPVINGELGQITTTSLIDGAYEIILTVYPAGLGSPKTCSTTFNLLKVIVYVSRVAKVPAISMAPIVGNPNPFDPLAELRLEVAPNYPPRSVGGLMTMDGAAYIYECAGRKIKKYAIRYAHVTVPGAEPAQPSKDDPVPPAFANLVSPLPLEYLGPDYYQPWTRLGPAPINLVNSWKTMTIGGTTYYKLNAGSWNSLVAGSGRFSLLLTAEDTAGHLYHDIQHVWLDNKDISGTVRIVKLQRRVNGTWKDIPACTDLLLSFRTIRIVGLAWDPLIDEAWPFVPPNDNFGYYRLDFWKQFGGAHALLGDTYTRVPALPAAAPVPIPGDADAEELAQWDLTTLDAGPVPSPYVPPADPKLYRKESCTYNVQLFATDTTVLNESTTHYRYHVVPVKIINDL